ncbi:MAG TPA: hypothetical protein VFH85_07765 [Gammaproteobacteria bacterium]|nr:hypothetical protein [Gammaproteobacteria bacterium]
MRYRPVNLIGGFNVDTAYPWAVEDTINYIPEKASSPNTRTPSKLRGAPGLRPYVQIAETGSPIRGSHNAEGRRFVVSGTTAYQITNAGIAIPLGTVPGVQRVNLAHNQIPGGNEIIITTGTPNSYVYNTVTQVFAKITDAGYPGAGSVDYIDTFLVQVEPFGRYWFWSAQADAMNYNTLDRAEAEASPDPIVGLAVNNFEVVVFGQSTLEFFYNAGTVTGTFQSKRIWIQHGCAAAATIQKMDNTLYWLSPERILYRLNGYQAQPVSTPQFEEAIADYDLSTAFAFVYEDQGHKIYYLTFPGGKTFGFDVTTGLMHRRESYGLDRWRLNTLEKWGDLWVGGDFQSGKLYTVDWGYMLEGVDTPLVAERVSGVISSNQNNVTIPYVEVLVDSGRPASAPVEFAEQPTGPTITGAAPDGALGVAYAGYTYALTGTAPLTVTVRSGSLPAGLAISTAGVVDTGTPTVLGSEAFTLRVTDANGLWDELTDTINITTTSIALGYDENPAGGYMVTSASGESWPGPGFASPGQWPVGLSGTRFFVFNGTFSYYTDDFGATRTTVTLDAWGGSHIGDYRDGVFLLPGSLAGMHRSTDNGASFTTTATPQSGFVAMIDGLAVSVNFNETSKSVDAGATWTAGGTIPATTTVQGVARSRTKIAFAGYDAAGPCAWLTSDGTTYTRMTIPGAAAAQISGNRGFKCGLVDGKDVWIVGTNESKVYWSDDDMETFNESDTEMGVTDIAFNGALFIISGVIGITPVIATTPDGKNLTLRTHPYLERVDAVASLPA